MRSTSCSCSQYLNLHGVSPLEPQDAVLADGTKAPTGVRTPSTAPTSVLEAQAHHAAALDVPGARLADHEAALEALPGTAAAQYEFIQERLQGFYGVTTDPE